VYLLDVTMSRAKTAKPIKLVFTSRLVGAVNHILGGGLYTPQRGGNF